MESVAFASVARSPAAGVQDEARESGVPRVEPGVGEGLLGQAESLVMVAERSSEVVKLEEV